MNIITDIMIDKNGTIRIKKCKTTTIEVGDNEYYNEYATVIDSDSETDWEVLEVDNYDPDDE